MSIRSDQEDLDFTAPVPKKKPQQQQQQRLPHPSIVRLEDSSSQDVINCGLCGGKHGIKMCLMTDESANLVEYRSMLILHAEDEPWEERVGGILTGLRTESYAR